MLTIGSLFSGIGGLELGLEWAGLGPVLWQVEKDPYCLKVLEKHWPGVRRYEDVKTIGRSVAPVDLICGGFPCQDVSSAGKRVGLSGSRSGLWYEFARIVKEIRPKWIIVENVASGAKLWVDPVRGELERGGYSTFPVPLSGFDVGAPHLRRRVFIVGHANGKRESASTEYAEVAQLSKYPSKSMGRPSRSDAGGSSERTAVADTNGSLEGHGHNGDGQVFRDSKNGGQARGTIQPLEWWSTEPNVGRVANGVPHRMDRVRALGNAVVPQCAQVIGEIIKELMG
ncbi:MAG: DNA cytosine methyltransferase [Planctomycetota bacterium]|jgi:DNA (cytosine-5)-methyltransferase 1